MKFNGWIIFAYKIPSEPSSIRVKVWRNLKTLGAHYIQQSVCICPNTEETLKKLLKLKLYIVESGGEVTLLEVEKLSLKSEDDIISEFNNERLLEYKEFNEEAEKFLKEIEEETWINNFSFREIEENEVELRRLKNWLVKIKKRDFFICELQGKAVENFEECTKAFEEFIQNVYKREGIIDEDISK
nr:Chromate resistance protein ChrB [uncultured Bacillus sp.]